MSRFYRINEHIQATQLRVINSQGEPLGIITRQEALEKAKAQGLDVVEVAPNASPPVARIIDFQKFKYTESKKERAAKKGGDSQVKELWFSPRIAEHDLGVRLNRIDEFLKEGHKVKLTVKFRGREMAHPEFGHLVLQKALEKLGDRVAIEREAKMEGRKISMIIAKSKGTVKSEADGEEQNAKTENK